MPSFEMNVQNLRSEEIGAQHSERLARQIQEWMRRLIDLSRRNRLLYFRPTHSSTLKLVEPSLTEIFNRLVIENKPWALLEMRNGGSVEVKRRSDQLLCISDASLQSVSMNLYRHSRTAFEERGIRILHIAFGFLSWNEVDQSEKILSPLILVPVELKRDSAMEPFQLYLAEEEVIVNPALKYKLWNDFRFDLGEFEDWEDDGLLRYLNDVELAARGRGWSVVYECWVGLFSFYKLPIYEDLKTNQEMIIKHPIIQALAGMTKFNGDISIDPKLLDKTVDPRQSYIVLDADSSQQACIELVKRGSNLIVQGPPGTGKSQTIVNLIAEFIARGKTVLFISEKMAALEVVYKRLKEVGLSHFCLELHSEKANKRVVVEELYKCLSTQIESQKTMSENEFNRLQTRRDQLNNYVLALHRKHQPLGLTAYQVLGQLSSLQRYPYIPPGLKDPWSLSNEYLNQAVDLARRLALVWSVVAEGDCFPWIGMNVTPYSMEFRSRIERTLKLGLDTLHQLIDSASNFALDLGLSPPNTIMETYWLLKLGELLHECPGLPEILLVDHDRPFAILKKMNKDDRKWPFVRIAHEYDERLIYDIDLDKLILIFSSGFRWLHPGFYLGRYRIKRLRKEARPAKNFIEDLKLAVKLKEAIDWSQRFRMHLGDKKPTKELIDFVETGSAIAPDISKLRSSIESFNSALIELESHFATGYPKVSGIPIRLLPFQSMMEHLHRLLENLDSLRDWVDYKNVETEFSRMGLNDLFKGLLLTSSPNPDYIPSIVKKLLLQAWVDTLFSRDQVLGQFRGLQHEQLIAEFRELDRMHWKMGAYRVIQQANKNKPLANIIPESEPYILRKEALKKKRHLSLRKLFPKIANLLLRIKPCLMMSPLTVSSFLDPKL